IAIWSALATMIRSAGSVSSGERRSALVRGSTRTIRASASSAPDVSPISATRSPTPAPPRAPTQLAGLHGHDQPVVGHAAVPAAVHAGHEARHGAGVRRAPPGARPGTAAGTDPDVVLVEP